MMLQLEDVSEDALRHDMHVVAATRCLAPFPSSAAAVTQQLDRLLPYIRVESAWARRDEDTGFLQQLTTTLKVQGEEQPWHVSWYYERGVPWALSSHYGELGSFVVEDVEHPGVRYAGLTKEGAEPVQVGQVDLPAMWEGKEGTPRAAALLAFLLSGPVFAQRYRKDLPTRAMRCKAFLEHWLYRTNVALRPGALWEAPVGFWAEHEDDGR